MEDIIRRANAHGYIETIVNPKMDWVRLRNENTKVTLDVIISTEMFCLTHMDGSIKITTGECNSFMIDRMFRKKQRELLDVLEKMNGPKVRKKRKPRRSENVKES